VQWNRISLFSGMINEMFFFSFFLSFSFGVLYLSVSTLSQSLTRRSKNRKEWCQKRKDKAQKKKKKKRSYLCPCLSRMKDETLREFDRLWRVCVCVVGWEGQSWNKKAAAVDVVVAAIIIELATCVAFLPSFLSVSVTALSLISFCFLSFGLYKRHLCAPLCVCVCVFSRFWHLLHDGRDNNLYAKPSNRRSQEESLWLLPLIEHFILFYFQNVPSSSFRNEQLDKLSLGGIWARLFCLSHNKKKKKKERKRDFLSSFLVHSSTFSNTHTHTKTFIFFSESCLMYNATSEILCVLPSKKNERKPKFSFKRGLLAIAAARQCGLGLLSLFFFPDAIALCIAVCVSNLLKERERRKKKKILELLPKYSFLFVPSAI
jgi:hypothetical protein